MRRVDTLGFGAGTSLGIESDPRAFTYLPEQNTFVTRVDSWTREGHWSRLQAVRVSADGTLTRTGRWTARSGGEIRTLPLGAGRVALTDDDRVRVVRVG